MLVSSLSQFISVIVHIINLLIHYVKAKGMTLFQHFQYLAVPVKLTVSLVVLPVIGAELVEIQVKVLHSEIKMAKLHVMLT